MIVRIILPPMNSGSMLTRRVAAEKYLQIARPQHLAVLAIPGPGRISGVILLTVTA